MSFCTRRILSVPGHLLRFCVLWVQDKVDQVKTRTVFWKSAHKKNGNQPKVSHGNMPIFAFCAAILLYPPLLAISLAWSCQMWREVTKKCNFTRFFLPPRRFSCISQGGQTTWFFSVSHPFPPFLPSIYIQLTLQQVIVERKTACWNRRHAFLTAASAIVPAGGWWV